jgi:mono/diheme cytochrome c family protein
VTWGPARGDTIIRVRNVMIFAALLFISFGANISAARPADQPQLPASYIPSGKQMFKEYCAACHGADAKGRGPVTYSLKAPAPDLTALAKRHGGKFPYDYVSGVLRFGPGFAAHGSADMPTWGALFQYLDKYNQPAVQKRIQNLCDYLASLQEK